ncbi:MAG: M48 family metallopeptidase [Spirochaetes bacterium]|nr:M48 family metallopeptidase [Spirochaetota bacterium]
MEPRLRGYLRDGLILIALAAVVFLAVWFLVPKKVPFGKPVGALALDLERQLGLSLEKAILHDPGLITDATVTNAVGAVKRRVLEGAVGVPFTVRVVVVKNREANAFTFPGGVIVVYSGLLSICDRPEELAAVLAHEVGHVSHRDSVRALAQQVGVAVLMAVISGGNGGQAGDLIQQVTAIHYGKSVEADADAYAVETLRRARLSPAHLAAFFRKIQALQGPEEALLKWVDVHPETEARIKGAEAAAAQTTVVDKPIPVNWAAMKRRLPSAF